MEKVSKREIDTIIDGLTVIGEDIARELKNTPRWRILKRRKLQKQLDEVMRQMVLFTLLKGELRKEGKLKE